MVRRFNPDAVRTPGGAYSHAAEVGPGGRLLFIAGQIGVDRDGNVLVGIDAQAEQAYRNIEAILADAGLGLGNLVKLTTYLTDPENLAGMRAARDKVLGEVKPPNTLLFISRLADPAFLIEVEAVAAED